MSTGGRMVVKSTKRITSVIGINTVGSACRYQSHQQNILVENLEEGAIVPHNLDSVFLAGRFFLPNGRELKYIDFECVDNGSIKIYLPMSDDNVVDTFTGEILLEKRR